MEPEDELEPAFGLICERADAGCTPARRRVLEELIQLAVEIALEGHEGRKIGTLFVFEDVDEVVKPSSRRIRISTPTSAPSAPAPMVTGRLAAALGAERSVRLGAEPSSFMRQAPSGKAADRVSFAASIGPARRL